MGAGTSCTVYCCAGQPRCGPRTIQTRASLLSLSCTHALHSTSTAAVLLSRLRIHFLCLLLSQALPSAAGSAAPPSKVPTRGERCHSHLNTA